MVNQRRISIGLNTLEAQTEYMHRQAKNENQSPPDDLKKRNMKMEKWKKAMGWI